MTARSYLGTYLKRNGHVPTKTLRVTLTVPVGIGSDRDTWDDTEITVIFERRGENVNIRREDGEPMCQTLEAYAESYLLDLPVEF